MFISHCSFTFLVFLFFIICFSISSIKSTSLNSSIDSKINEPNSSIFSSSVFKTSLILLSFRLTKPEIASNLVPSSLSFILSHKALRINSLSNSICVPSPNVAQSLTSESLSLDNLINVLTASFFSIVKSEETTLCLIFTLL